MNENLRPMHLGEILDRTFHIYRSRFFVFLAVAAVPLTAKMALTVAGFIVSTFIGQTTLSSTLKHQLSSAIESFTSRITSPLFSYAIWFVFALLIAQIVTQQNLRVRDAFADCLNRWRGWLIMSGLFWLIGSELPRLLRTTRFLLDAWLSMPYWWFSILTTLEGFVLLAPLFLSVPVWALEKQSPLTAVARSWTLSRRAYGKMFIAWILQELIALSIAFLFGGLIYYVLRQLSGGSEWSAFSPSRTTFWITLPTYIATILAGPIFPIALTLIYYDQRIRLEGYDIEQMMDAAGMNAPASEPISSAVDDPVTLEESQG
jgi:hypothetical protein